MQNTEDIEDIIVEILKAKNSYDFNTSLALDDLFEECKKINHNNLTLIEAALIKMIDKDIIEYEMDDDCKMNIVWLLGK